MAVLMLSNRSIGHDWAANRRAALTGTLRMLRGAVNADADGSVRARSTLRAASGDSPTASPTTRATPTAAFPTPATARPAPTASACTERPLPDDGPTRPRGVTGSAYVSGIPVRSGSVVSVDCSKRSALTPSIIAWCTFV